jgi:hypothetical protein
MAVAWRHVLLVAHFAPFAFFTLAILAGRSRAKRAASLANKPDETVAQKKRSSIQQTRR